VEIPKEKREEGKGRSCKQDLVEGAIINFSNQEDN
jgi:hypothetical protein